MNKASALASVALSSHLPYPLPVAGNETVHPGSLLPSSSMLNCSQVQSSQRYRCWCPLAGALQHGFRRQQIHSRLLARLSPAFFRRRSRRGIIDIERHRDYGHESRVFLSSSFLSISQLRLLRLGVLLYTFYSNLRRSRGRSRSHRTGSRSGK